MSTLGELASEYGLTVEDLDRWVWLHIDSRTASTTYYAIPSSHPHGEGDLELIHVFADSADDRPHSDGDSRRYHADGLKKYIVNDADAWKFSAARTAVEIRRIKQERRSKLFKAKLQEVYEAEYSLPVRLYVSRDSQNQYLIPVDVRIPEGDQCIRTVHQGWIHVDEPAIAVYKISDAEAAEFHDTYVTEWMRIEGVLVCRIVEDEAPSSGKGSFFDRENPADFFKFVGMFPEEYFASMGMADAFSQYVKNVRARQELVDVGNRFTVGQQFTLDIYDSFPLVRGLLSKILLKSDSK